jgi:glycosyltransferase involved in cell wall biosynthesis
MAEAMACGTPVIGLRRGAVPEVVEDGVTGFVCATVDEMVSAVTKCADLDRARCRARVEKLYSEKAITDAYLEIYSSMTKRICKTA